MIYPYERQWNSSKNGIILNFLRPILKFDLFLKYLQKCYFPYLRQFVEWQRIHVYLTASDSLENISGRKLHRCRSIVPDQERLGRIMVNLYGGVCIHPISVTIPCQRRNVNSVKGGRKTPGYSNVWTKSKSFWWWIIREFNIFGRDLSAAFNIEFSVPNNKKYSAHVVSWSGGQSSEI